MRFPAAKLVVVSLACAGAALVAGCGSSGGSDGGSSAAPVSSVRLTAHVAPATKPVSEVAWNLPTGEPTSLDPAASAIDSVSTIVGNLCEGLFRFGPHYQLIPNLATKFSQPNSTTYVFDLRPHVTFWDGHPMTAADVVYSMERFENPALGSSWSAAYQFVKSIAATGPRQVTVTLKQPDALFKWGTATPAMDVVEKSFVEHDSKAFGTPGRGVMCTGPFKYSSWTQGQNVVIAKNTHYWDKARVPLAGRIKFVFDTGASSQTAALSDGSVQGQWNSTVSTFSQLKKSSAGSLMFASSLSPTFINWFVDRPSVKSSAIRAALHDVIPYASIAKNVFGGSAVPIKTVTPPATWGYAQSVFKSAYDAMPAATQNLAAAKKLVAKAGAQADPVVLGYPAPDPALSNIALAIQSAAAEVGLKVKLDAMNPAQYTQVFSSAKARAPLSGLLVEGYLDYPEPLEYDSYSTTHSYYNFGGYSNPAYDKLIAQAQRTLDSTARARLLVKAQSILYASNTFAPIVTQYVNVFVSKKLTGVTPDQNFYYTAWADKLGAR